MLGKKAHRLNLSINLWSVSGQNISYEDRIFQRLAKFTGIELEFMLQSLIIEGGHDTGKGWGFGSFFSKQGKHT